MTDFKESFNFNRAVQFDPLDFTISVNSSLYPECTKAGIYWVRTKSKRVSDNQIIKKEQFEFDEEKRLHGTHWKWDKTGKIREVVATYNHGQLVQ